MYNFNIFIFYTLLMLSLMVGMNSISIFYLWLSIEINMMSFIPMILYFNKNYNFGAMKYFLIQSFSSSLMMFLMLNLYYMNIITFLFFLLMLSLFMKMGYFPFHMWYLNLLKDLDWISISLLMTIQKILPFYMLWYIFTILNYLNINMFNMEFFFLNYYLIIIFLSFNIMMLVYSNNSIKMFMGLSSINHMSWLILLIFIDIGMWYWYFSFYMQILINLILMFNTYYIFSFNHMYMIKNCMFKYFIFFLVLMLMMMPPLIGFFLKMFSIEILMKFNIYSIIYILLNLSIFMSYYYLKLMMTSFLFNNSILFNNMNLIIQYKKNNYYCFYFNMSMMFLYWFMM